MVVCKTKAGQGSDGTLTLALDQDGALIMNNSVEPGGGWLSGLSGRIQDAPIQKTESVDLSVSQVRNEADLPKYGDQRPIVAEAIKDLSAFNIDSNRTCRMLLKHWGRCEELTAREAAYVVLTLMDDRANTRECNG